MILLLKEYLIQVPKIVPEMIEGIHSENPEVQLDCVKRFRKVISHCK